MADMEKLKELLTPPLQLRDGKTWVWRGSLEIAAVLDEVQNGVGRLDARQIKTLAQVSIVLSQAEQIAWPDDPVGAINNHSVPNGIV